MEQQAVSRTSFEAASADYERASAAARKQEAVLNYTKIKISQARTNLEIARKNLRDSVIYAPYDGVITARYHEEGEFAAAGGKILDLEDQTRMEVSARISAVYYDMVSLKTETVLHFSGREICRAVITYISPDIDPLSRTFEIRAAIPGVKNAVSGSLYDMDIILRKRNGLGIPSDSVIARARGEYALFAVKDGKTAEEIAVTPGFATGGFTELLNAEPLKDRDIVVSGQYFLNDNSPVHVISGEKGQSETGR